MKNKLMFPVLLLIIFLAAMVFFPFPSRADTTNYIYDDLNRLKQVDYGNGHIIEYEYDEVGNRQLKKTVVTPYSLTVQKTGTGAGWGTVTASPAGINCGTYCDSLYTAADTVTLTATTTAPAVFSGWSEGGCSGTDSCTVTMNADTTVVATFYVSPPSGLTATAASATQINLTWSDNVTNANDRFVIERMTGATGTYVPIAMVGANTKSYASMGLMQNTTYFYRVRAYYNNGGGFSAYTNEANAKTLIPTAPTISQIEAGNYHTLALKSDGTLWAWGHNGYGQLGLGINETAVKKEAPIQIGEGNTWVSIAAGGYHNLAVKSDGTLWAWGKNTLCELGDGTTDNRRAPVQVGEGNTWTSVAAGAFHSLALKSDGTLWAWGYDYPVYAPTAPADWVEKSVPVQKGVENTWVSIAAGEYHSLALKSDGTLWAWGENTAGQLGNGTSQASINKSVPAQVSGGNNGISISAGAYHSLAVKSNGTLWAWGMNNLGQLGDGSSTYKSVPVPVSGENTWVSISAGADHNLAVKSNGTLWAWGRDDYGQVGDGSRVERSFPFQISGETWVSISAGAYHSLAVKSDGTLWAWGSNYLGQLGDGTFVDKNTPHLVIGGAPISISNGATYATSMAVVLNLTAIDLNGVSQMQFSNDNVTWSAAAAYAPTKSWTLSTGDGIKTVYAKFKDSAGNWSAVYSDTIILDTTVPTGTITISNGTTYTMSTVVTLNLTASDTNGVAQMQFSNDNTTWSTAETYAATKSWTLTTEDDTKTVYVKYKDNVGNWSTASSDTIILDTTAPAGTIAISNGENHATGINVILNLTVSDMNGVSQMQFSNDNVVWSAIVSYGTATSWKLTSGDGTKTVYARLKDNAGNWNTVIITDTIILDTACNVRIANTPSVCYLTIQEAYDIAPDLAVIQSKNATYVEANITIYRPVNVTMKGGYSSDYTSIVGTTKLSGMITTTATGGTLTIGDFELVSSNMDNNYNRIVAVATSGGSISPVGTVTVAQGNNETFTIIPDPNFIVVDVLVDGISVGVVNAYSFSGVTTNHTIEAKFAKPAYTITVDAGPGGTIAPAGSVDRVVGNWNGSMTPGIGVYQDGKWFFDQNGNGLWDGPNVDRQYSFGSGLAGAVPVVGDWTGDGTSKIGVFRDGTWYLDMNHVNMASYVYVSPQNSGDIAWNAVGGADFNADGKSDILWRNTTTGENSVWYMDGVTLTSYELLASMTDLNWQIVGTGDFNSDGKADLLWRNATTGENTVWYMNGAAKTGYAFLETIADLNWKIVGTGDFNADGKADILWRHMATGDNAVWYMDGVTKAAYAFLDPVPDLNQQIVGVGDFNGDGQTDILFQHKVSGDLIVWFMNGIARTNYAYFNPNNPGSPDWKAHAVQDYNGDGKPDILFQNAVSGDLAIWHMVGYVVNMSNYVYVNPQNAGDLAWQAVGGVDFNADGKPDILWRNTTTGLNSVWFMDGTILTGSAVLDSVPDLGWQIVGGADFNSDGKPDILWRNTTTGLNAVWFMDGAIHTGSDFGTSVPDLNWNIVGIGDFNNDSKPDILWRNAATGENAVWYMDGVTKTALEYLDPVPDLNQQIVGVGDFNSDGQLDILFQHKVSGNLIAWFMNGIVRTGYACLKPNNPGSPGWKARSIQDFNGDGKPDILFQNVTSGDLVVRHMIGIGDSAIFDYGDASYTFGISGDLPVTGDWNGDGKTEIGVVRGGGTWFLDMNGNGAWENGIDAVYSFGAPGDKPITGDWNGDGRTKIGVVRGNIWFLDMNGNGISEAGEPIYYFGDTGDVPITGDWTGDGRTKIGVLRGNTWYLDMNGNGAWEGTSIDKISVFDDWIANRVTVPYGASQLFTMTPNAGYHIKDVLVDGVSEGPVPTYPFNDVKSDHAIEAVFSNTYTLTVTIAGEGVGTVTSSPSGTTCASSCLQSFVQGATVTLTATSDVGSTFSGWSGACSGTGTCTVVSDADNAVTAAFNSLPAADFSASQTTVGTLPFVPITFTDRSLHVTGARTWNFGDGTTYTTFTQENPVHTYVTVGTYTVSLTVLNAYGTDSKTVSITVLPCPDPVRINRNNGAILLYYPSLRAAYEKAMDNDIIEALAVNFIENFNAHLPVAVTMRGGYNCGYTQQIGNSTLQGSLTTSNGTVTMGNFELVTGNPGSINSIISTAGPGGGITPAGTVIVAQGKSETFTITPALDYLVVDVIVDGVSAGPVNTFTLNNVTTNHTIEAKFARAAYTITVNAGPGGTISPPGSNTRVTGDWNGDGKTKFGLFRGWGAWYLDMDGNGVWDTGEALHNFGGAIGDTPVTGDWNGDGRTKIGVFRNNALWYLDIDGNGVWDAGEAFYNFGGAIGDTPVTGDWNGDGRTKIGVFRNNAQWYLDMDGNGVWDAGEALYNFGGVIGDIPVTGDWNGDGRTKIGVLRGNILYLDMNGNGTWEGPVIDRMDILGEWIANRVTVPYGVSQLFTMTPNAGYHIADVLVDSVSTGPTSTYLFDDVKADHTIEAVFSNTYALTLTIAGEGVGTVTSSPTGTTCASSCSQSFVQGSTITLTATANSGSTFVGWSGGGCTETGICTVALNADTAITALFNPALPVAEFSGTPAVAVQSVTVNFTDLSTENPTIWSWDFGDGATSTLKNPTHTYSVVGTYNVTLMATNASGSNTVVKTGYIVVQPYVRIVGSTTGYRNIQEAYDAAPDGAIIQARDLNLVENLNANSTTPKTIILQGGYNSDYSIGTGVTNMKGSIMSSKGSMTIKNFVLQK